MSELNRLAAGRLVRGPVVCIVMDGIGEADPSPGNAVTCAQTPGLDRLKDSYPFCTLLAHGTHVGMPNDEDMGNSEVGHNAIGAGRIFDQGSKLVGKAIDTGSIFEGPQWKTAIGRSKGGGTLHFLGLVSDGNVHSHIDHLKALISQAVGEDVKRIRVHALLDGRDVGQYSALEYITPLEKWFENLDSDVRFASGGGRMVITMDRYEADWDMVERGWRTHVRGEGPTFSTASEAIEQLRKKHPDTTDQWLPPFVIKDDSRGGDLIQDGDNVILFNFRGDRAIEISRAFEGNVPFMKKSDHDIFYAGLMEYDGDLKVPSKYLVDPPAIDRTVGELLSKAGLRQLAISETQKFGHVTFFWNGNRSGAFDDELETYVEIPSDNIPFDQAPEMKAVEITEAVIARLDEGYDHIRINYANGDMVGHTGKLEAAIEAIETVDNQINRLVSEVLLRMGAVIITADHGNADVMFRDVGDKRVVVCSHTLNPVPFLLVSGESLSLSPPDNAGLANIAATILQLLGFECPKDYQPSLIAT